RVLRLGADYYILKPFDLVVLAQRIKQLGSREETTMTPTAAPAAAGRTNSNLEIDVTRLILELGIPAHIRGYKFLRDAIILAVNRTGSINSVTKNIYPVVASKYETTSSRVERAIRHSIDIAWERGNYESIYKIFGHTIDQERGRPTNSEFIAMLADRIRMMNLAG
ncbi:MAG: sporulation transcription factor Spo0A, partial [Firmicutes bacterium]|nr:sporulation transcription factor Spo0A [Bacillota bacterium]